MNVHAPDCPQAQRCTCPVSKDRADCLFVVTADQLLELASACQDAYELWSRSALPSAEKMRQRYLRWQGNLRREHVARFGNGAEVSTGVEGELPGDTHCRAVEKARIWRKWNESLARPHDESD